MLLFVIKSLLQITLIYLKQYNNVQKVSFMIYKNNYVSNNTFNYLKDDNEFLKKLKIILKEEELFENELMSKHTTFRIGGPAKYFVNLTSF